MCITHMNYIIYAINMKWIVMQKLQIVNVSEKIRFKKEKF
jgi:hypothetical protein